MTEYFKFTAKDNYILLNNEIWAICEDKQNARKVVTALRDMVRGGRRLEKENEQLKQKIKDLRLGVLDSLHDADDIKCSCNPCVVEECVKKVVE